jgi:hypothetical protein
MKEKWKVINGEGSHEYTIIVNSELDTFTLKYSKGDQWTENVKNKKIIKISDDCEVGLRIKLFEPTFPLHKSDISEINYSQAEQLSIILRFVNEYDARGKSYESQTQFTYHKINKK